jgi:hypothetical protein
MKYAYPGCAAGGDTGTLSIDEGDYRPMGIGSLNSATACCGAGV